MSVAVFPGSFDPPTRGHLDMIQRASVLVDTLYVAVGSNVNKNHFMRVEQRVDLLEKICADLPNVQVESFSGLVVDFCQQVGASFIVKGLRNQADLMWEQAQASVNKDLRGIDTLFVLSRPELTYVSSSIVRELAAFHQDVSRYVPPVVARAVADNGDTIN